MTTDGRRPNVISIAAVDDGGKFGERFHIEQNDIAGGSATGVSGADDECNNDTRNNSAGGGQTNQTGEDRADVDDGDGK